MLKTATIVKQATKEKPYLILADRRKMYSKQEWLNLRQNYIGGSDAAAVMSCNPWRTPFQVFAEKKGLVKRQPAGEAAYFGNLFESLLVEEFCKRTGYKSVSVPFVFQSAQSPWLIADLDSVVNLGNGKFGVLEIKTTNTFSGADDWNNGEVGNLPISYYIQCQEYLYVTGLDIAFIACLIGGQKFIYQEIQRDEETINAIVQMTGAWYQNYFLKNVPPPVEHTDSAYLGQLYPKAEEKQVEHRIIRVKQIAEGSLTSAVVHPREVFAPAVIAHAASILVAHNHPSGEPYPSTEDRNLTKALEDAGNILGIPLLDHVVIGDGRYYSFKEHGGL